MVYTPLNDEVFENLRTKFYENPINKLVQNICVSHDPLELCISHCRIRETEHIFTHKIENEGKPVTDQKYAGFCWVFAGLNVIRIPFMEKYELDEFEFSQPYFFFWDTVEKSYFFLNKIVEAARKSEPIDGRLMEVLLTTPISCGGQWDMFVNIINKHGLMPKKYFPDTYVCEGPSSLSFILNSKLREFSMVLRKMVENGSSDTDIKAKIDEQMEIVYRINGIYFGIPPKQFTWEYLDKSKTHHSIGPITPKEFYATHVKPLYNVDDKVCLINDPRPIVQYNQLYTIDFNNNMIGGRKVTHNNQPIDLLVELCATSIKNEEPVWFSCDMAQRPSGGLFDLKIRDCNSVFGVEVFSKMTKAERMLYGDSHSNHAMVFTAVTLDDDGKPTKWRVENSYGIESGEQGYLLMTNDWFKEFIYHVVVDKSIVPKEVMEVFEKDPIVLPVWKNLGFCQRPRNL